MNNLRHCTRFINCRDGKCDYGQPDDRVKPSFQCTDSAIKQFSLEQRTQQIDNQTLTVSVQTQWPNLKNLELEVSFETNRNSRNVCD